MSRDDNSRTRRQDDQQYHKQGAPRSMAASGTANRAYHNSLAAGRRRMALARSTAGSVASVAASATGARLVI